MFSFANILQFYNGKNKSKTYVMGILYLDMFSFATEFSSIVFLHSCALYAHLAEKSETLFMCIDGNRRSNTES